MDTLEGGYITHKAPAILSGFYKHTLDLPGRTISQSDLEATNRLQATPWAVNRFVLQVARQMLVDDVQSPVVPGNVRLAVPGRMEDEAWAAADEAVKKKHLGAISRVHAENAGLTGRRNAFVDALDTATQLEDRSAFYFVWTHDFRLRRYPVSCGGLSPQGSDLGKSLMHFANGKALGPLGFYWLCVRAANAWGHDKLPLDERYGWALDNLSMIVEVAELPVRHRESWESAEAPWEALATAHEIYLALRGDDRTTFISHLPIPMDGTCNGLQHLSAMGLDPVGALATNLCAGVARHDVYLTVAEHAARRVETDAAKGLPAAMLWLGHVNRDAVKRAVLATPYGVTREGIRRQLVEDGRVPHSDLVSQNVASAYFRDVIVDALAGTVVSANVIMAWLQSSAFRLAEAGLPMIWKTPTGSTVQQAYKERSVRRVETLSGKIVLHEEAEGGGLDAKKQALGSAPQIVHSFDASHLAATVNTLGRRGITDFAMVHDSFATHAADTTTMNAVLRRTFVDLYTPDRLVELAEGFHRYAPHVVIPSPPSRGTFDLQANVPGSQFFFS
ncbi:MAG: DNA-dependent polymerase domain protein [Rhodospirillales bacterium]|nr:DNA-dependent polymerase domain protein [Rhodospirillales bacterium]